MKLQLKLQLKPARGKYKGNGIFNERHANRLLQPG